MYSISLIIYKFYLIFCVEHTSLYFYCSIRWSARMIRERFQQIYHKEKPKVSIILILCYTYYMVRVWVCVCVHVRSSDRFTLYTIFHIIYIDIPDPLGILIDPPIEEIRSNYWSSCDLISDVWVHYYYSIITVIMS